MELAITAHKILPATKVWDQVQFTLKNKPTWAYSASLVCQQLFVTELQSQSRQTVSFVSQGKKYVEALSVP